MPAIIENAAIVSELSAGDSAVRLYRQAQEIERLRAELAGCRDAAAVGRQVLSNPFVVIDRLRKWVGPKPAYWREQVLSALEIDAALAQQKPRPAIGADDTMSLEAFIAAAEEDAQQKGKEAPIVGHKTFRNGAGFRHEPLRRSEADKLLAAIEEDRNRRRELMPTEQAAIDMMFSAWLRLKEDFGWNDAVYCPKDGTTFNVIENGSTGIHPCTYEGEWPDGRWWTHDEGDSYPSRPALWKPRQEKP